MKTLRHLWAATALLALALPSFAQVRSYKDIKTPPLRKMSVPQPKRIQLANGMVIFLMPDRELPLVRGRATIRGGERDVPVAKSGLAGIYSQAWRTGGTTAKTGDELDEFLESRAARVETFADSDSSSITFDVLKEDLDAVFPIFLDLMKNPGFRQEKIDLAKTQVRTGISRRNDEPGAIIGREATKLGYGANSPYTHQPEYATLNAITRDDLVAFHKRFLHANNMIVGISGDFDQGQMEKRLRQAFGSWPRGPQAPPAPAAFNPARPGLYFIPKSDVTQANIAMVHPGIQRNNPDYYAVSVMNEIFSNGFSGRLMQHLRTDRGLTYGVGGGFSASWDHPGLFRVQMATKSGTTLESIDALKGEVNDLITKPFTADELALAKESVLNAFVFTIDSPAKVLDQALLLEFYGFPQDYFQKFPSNIDRVTAEDVARAAKKYVNPNQLAVLVVGNEKDFEKPLTSLGPITTVDIAIPEGDTTPKRAVSGDQEGAALIRKVQDFTGGKAKIDAVKAVHVAGSATRMTPQGAMDMQFDNLTVYPDQSRTTLKMPMGEMTMVTSGDSAFAIMPGMGVRDLPPSQRDNVRTEAKQEMLSILKNADRYTYAVTGTEKVGAVEGKIVDISGDGVSMKWVVDPATGRVLRRISKARMGQGDMVTEYSDWKSFAGITVPTASTAKTDGEDSGKTTITTVEINPPVDPKVFEKPAS